MSDIDTIIEVVKNQASHRDGGCLSMDDERKLISEIERLRAPARTDVPLFTPWRVGSDPHRETIAILDAHGHEIGAMHRRDLAEAVVRSIK